MQKHIYLSVFLGLIFNTLFFAQTDIRAEVEDVKVEKGITEVTIERTIVDADGNETKYVITKVGEEAEGVMGDNFIKNLIHRDFKTECKKPLNTEVEKRVYILGDNVATHSRRVNWNDNEHNSKPKVRMGVELKNDDRGVKISHVSGNSAAQEAGLQTDDIIILLDNQGVKTHQELTELLSTKEVGEQLLVTYLRDDSEHTVSLTLKENKTDHKRNCGHLDKPCLGVQYNSWNDGIKVTKIYSESGAEGSGLQAGDKLLKVNGDKYAFTSQFDRMIKSQKPGDNISIEYQRGGEVFTTEAEVGVWDECGVCQLLSNQVDDTPEVTLQQPADELQLNAFDMFPVPARDQITVSFMADQAPIEVSFFDVNGKIVDQEKISNFNGSFTKTYKLENVVKGTAIITITQNGKSTSRQAIIQ